MKINNLKKKNILIITDSLGLPRQDDLNNIGESWPSLLNQSTSYYYNSYFYCHGGLDSNKITDGLNGGYLAAYKPDIIILQIGQVDSFPRIMTKMEERLINRKLINYISSQYYYQLSKFREITYVSKKTFYNNLIKLKHFFPNVQWIVLPIIPTTNFIENYAYNVLGNKQQYNKVLNDIFTDSVLGDLYSVSNTQQLFTSDDQHLSLNAHIRITKRIIIKLDEIENKD